MWTFAGIRRISILSALLSCTLADCPCGSESKQSSAKSVQIEDAAEAQSTAPAGTSPYSIKFTEKFGGGPTVETQQYLSVGEFVAQVTICAPALTKLEDGQSTARFFVVHDENSPQWFTAGPAATYDAAIGGFHLGISSGFGVPTPVASIADTSRVDLRIEQTATQLFFKARKTPDPVSTAGGFTTVQTLNVPGTGKTYRLGIAMEGVPKGAAFMFQNFSADSDGGNGLVAGPINVKLRESLDAIDVAIASLDPATLDLVAAGVAMSAAKSAAQNAKDLLTAAATANTLPSFALSKPAEKAVDALLKDINSAQTLVAAGKPAKLKSARTKLANTEGNVPYVIAQLAGIKSALSKKGLLYSLRHPPGG